jgi:hypothetical protein
VTSPPRDASPGTALDQRTTTQDIKSAKTTLEAGLGDVSREICEGQVTLATKKQSARRARFASSTRGLTTTLTGLFTLGGEEKLANQIHPSLAIWGKLKAAPSELVR